jgi:hypothetical protein
VIFIPGTASPLESARASLAMRIAARPDGPYRYSAAMA